MTPESGRRAGFLAAPLAQHYADLLAFGWGARSADDLGDVEGLVAHLKEELRRVEDRVRETGYPDLIDAARLAITAFVDEMVLGNRKWDKRTEYFQRAPSRELYKDRAGELFFEKLDELRRYPGENRLLLELYYQCLAVGFQGRYRDDEKGRDRLFRELSAELGRDRQWGPEGLAPHAVPAGRNDSAPSGYVLPIWVPVLGAGVLAIVLVLSFQAAGKRMEKQVPAALAVEATR